MILKPTKRDVRDKKFQFHKLFGGATKAYREIDLDAGLTMINQDAINRPTQCTAICVTDIATDQDKIVYSHDYEYMKTIETQNIPPDSDGADARTALKVATVFGLLDISQEPSIMRTVSQSWSATPVHWDVALDQIAAKHIKPAYIPIQTNLGVDWFDAIYAALDKGFSVGVGTEWSSDFESPNVTNVLTDYPTGLFWGHMYKISGITFRQGQWLLKLKTWQGDSYGEKGYVYASRTLINKLMSVWGAYAGTLAHVPSDVVDALKQQRTSILETLLVLLQNEVNMLRYKMGLL